MSWDVGDRQNFLESSLFYIGAKRGSRNAVQDPAIEMIKKRTFNLYTAVACPSLGSMRLTVSSVGSQLFRIAGISNVIGMVRCKGEIVINSSTQSSQMQLSEGA
jgi:hypothetical protein